jgi:hypothetical protein
MPIFCVVLAEYTGFQICGVVCLLRFLYSGELSLLRAALAGRAAFLMLDVEYPLEILRKCTLAFPCAELARGTVVEDLEYDRSAQNFNIS